MTRPTLAARLRAVALASVLAITSIGITAIPGPSGQVRDSANGFIDGIAALLSPRAAQASFCADNPGFTGRLTASSGSTTAVTRITDPDVYGYISDVTDDWSCTAYFRYSGVGWNTEASKGRLDWGNLIESTTVSCNYFIGTTDYVKGNPSTDCPDSDAEYALQITLSAERVYQQDSNHDSVGDVSFIHSDCGTLYGGGDGEALSGTEANPENFNAGNVANRPGSNCDPLTLDSFNTSQTITYDATAPTLAFSFPPAGGPTVVPAAYAGVTFTATDNLAGFGGASDWDLKRRVAPWTGTACGTFADDTGTNAVVSGTTAGAGQVSSQSLAVGFCYQWTLAATDQNGNTATTITSGTIRTDTAGLLGSQPQFGFESWDLGAGDSLSVSMGSGNLLVSHPIVELPIRGGALDLSLAYNSHDSANVGMGPGWRLDAFRRLTLNGDGSVTFTDADGARHTFTNPVVNGTVTTYSRPATLYATLVKDTAQSANEFTLTYREQSKDRFDIAGSEGLLVKQEDRFGNALTFAYSGGNLATITDPANRVVDLAWDTAPTPDRLTSITDWAYVSGGIVQTTATGSRRQYRFFYDGSGNLAGWADPIDTSGSCPTNASHRTCLGYTSSLLSSIAKTQTYETISGNPGNLGTATRTLTTSIAYTKSDVATITDAAGAQATASHPPVAGQTKIVRPGTPASETTYALESMTDAYGRIRSVFRKLGAAQIEQRTSYDTTYPIEPQTVIDNYVNGVVGDGSAPTVEDRKVSTTYIAGSLGLVQRLTEPLTGSTNRTTDYTYNANNDVTELIVALDGSGTTRTITRFCYTTSGCSTSATDLVLRSRIDNYQDGTKGGSTGYVDDVTTEFQFDANGQRIRETRWNYQTDGSLLDSRAIGWTYDANGNLITEVANHVSGTVTNPGDDITPNATTNARTDLTTTYAYDTAGNRVSSADPRRAIETAKGTSLGADDFISRTSHDALNEPTLERLPTTPGQSDCSPSPACREATTTYDELGLVREATDNPGVVRATKYDQIGRALETYEDPTTGSGDAAITSITTYDAQDRVLTTKNREQAETGATLGSTTFAYDELGRVTLTKEAASTSLENQTLVTWDALGRKASEQTGYQDSYNTGQTTIWTYDLGGRATKTDDEFTCATTTYDYRDLALTQTEGLATASCANGTPRTVTDTYDALGRLIESKVTAGVGLNDILAAPTYDSAGNQRSTSTTKVGTPNVVKSSTFTLNPLDELVAETRRDDGTAVGWTKANFDPAGNSTDRCVWGVADPGTELCKAVGQSFTTAPAVHTTTGFDARDQRISLKLPALGETTYDPVHDYQVAAIYVPTGTGKEHQTIFGYDSRHRLWSVDLQLCTISSGHACSSTVTTGSNDYLYDDNDNRTQVIESKDGGTATTRNYCYDALDRLRAMQTPSTCTITSGTETFTYDDAGNRLTAAGVSYTYDAQGQLATCSAGCGTVTHDAAGRISAFNGWNLTYDAEGRLSAACKVALCATGDMVTMAYDGEGRRIELVSRPNGGATTTTSFRFQGDDIAQEYVGTAPPVLTRTYVTDEAGRIVKVCDPDCSGSNPQYLVTWNGHGDALGLWRINADGTLTLANSFTYSTWGAPTTTVASGFSDLGFRYLYVGAQDVQWDNTFSLGLFYMHARHYSPVIGRFLQPDPSALEANLYGYAANGPVTKVDPSGTSAAVLAAAIGGLLIVGTIFMISTFASTRLHRQTFTALPVPRLTLPQLSLPRVCLWGCRTISHAAPVERRILERELREGGYWPDAGRSGRGDHEVWKNRDGRIISLPRHRNVSPGVAKKIRAILRGPERK